MSAKFKNTKVIYSTNPDYNQWEDEEEVMETLSKDKQKLYVSIDKKQRKGKKVTLVTGFIGVDNDLKELGKILKSKCGVGGTVKDGEILIQGDFKEKVNNILLDLGYKSKMIG